jgi:fructokinase
MKKPVIVGIGELLWDLLPAGKQLGGAPANFVYHAGKLGAEAYIVSVVGNDDYGKEILNILDHQNMSDKYIKKDNLHNTGTVSVSLDNKGVPTYIIHKNAAWDFISLDNDLISLAQKTDAVCFGSLAQRSEVSRHSITGFLKSLKHDCLKICDINLRQNFYSKKLITESLALTDILKLNDEELKVISELLSFSGSENDLLLQILNKFNLQLIALTKGAKGSILITKREYSGIQAPEIKIADTVGAGDAFTAAMIYGFLQGYSIKSIHKNANNLAGYVCSKPGAMPPLEKELINSFDKL